MLRSVWVIVVGVGVTLFLAPLVIIVGSFNSRARMIDWCVKAWGRSIAGAAGLRMRSEGFDALDPNGCYIVVANHHSYLDIPALLSCVPFRVRFMAKKSLFQIPIFGWGLSAAGFIPVDRKNRKTAVKSFDRAADRIRKGNSIVIFPEEGRTRTAEMLPFQRGAFLLALRANLPIVPVAIIGTYEALPVGKLAIRPGKVTIRAAAPVDPAGFSVRGKEDLIAFTRGEIERMLISSK